MPISVDFISKISKGLFLTPICSCFTSSHRVSEFLVLFYGCYSFSHLPEHYKYLFKPFVRFTFTAYVTWQSVDSVSCVLVRRLPHKFGSRICRPLVWAVLFFLSPSAPRHGSGGGVQAACGRLCRLSQSLSCEATWASSGSPGCARLTI